MTTNIFHCVVLMGHLFSTVTINHTLAQNNCENYISAKVKQEILFHTKNCTMLYLPERSSSVSCIETVAENGGYGAAVESKYSTSWCCVFQGGQVRSFNAYTLSSVAMNYS